MAFSNVNKHAIPNNYQERSDLHSMASEANHSTGFSLVYIKTFGANIHILDTYSHVTLPNLTQMYHFYYHLVILHACALRSDTSDFKILPKAFPSLAAVLH